MPTQRWISKQTYNFVLLQGWGIHDLISPLYVECAQKLYIFEKLHIFSIAVNEFPVLKADGIKYIMIFRNQVSFSSVVKNRKIKIHRLVTLFILAKPHVSYLAVW